MAREEKPTKAKIPPSNIVATLKPTILAGGEFDIPTDSPGSRLDITEDYNFVGAFEVSNDLFTFRGSAVALSPHWIISAGHNADLTDIGNVDPSWSGTVHLPGFGRYSVSESYLHPDYSGFANPFINDDLALFKLTNPLPNEINFPMLGTAEVNDTITLVGFGRSGYGSYGYTSSASLNDRRFGLNVIDSMELDDEGSGLAEVFRYDFDAPSTSGQPGGSLGNDRETIVGPGDSGGAALRWDGEQWILVGVNTFTKGFGGHFGDTGGGILVDPYSDWIAQTTGIPEPGSVGMMFLGFVLIVRQRKRY